MSVITTAVQHSRAETAWIRLMRVYHQIDKHTAEIMKKYGLSVSRFDVLVHAGVREGRTQQELADAMFVTKGNICQLLDGMEAEALLYRRRKGRTNHIFLTDVGRTRRQQAMEEQLQAIETAMSALTDLEKEQLNKLLRTIDRTLSNKNLKEGQQL
jgi:DNA-binding MarR family transcriptional regulator